MENGNTELSNAVEAGMFTNLFKTYALYMFHKNSVLHLTSLLINRYRETCIYQMSTKTSHLDNIL